MLTPEHQQQLAACRRQWISQTMSAGESEARDVERDVVALYDNAGLAPPKTIIRCEGPAALEEAWAEHARLSEIGANVRHEIFSWPQDQSEKRLRARLGNVVAHIHDRMRPWRIDMRRAPGDFGTFESSSAFSRRQRLFNRLMALLRLRPGDEDRYGWHAGFGQNEYAGLGMFEFCRHVLGLENETQFVHPLLDMARCGGWVLPHANVCWLSERPTMMSLDENSRLHSRIGPALAYADGSRWYAWKGIPLPEWVIERSHEINAQLIETQDDPVLRRCIIEIVGAENYVSMSRAICISEDNAGKLWIRPWDDFGREGWAAVEVVNGTPEPDGSFKHYFLQVPFTLRTARAAVAWTYGLSDEEYAALAYRT